MKAYRSMMSQKYLTTTSTPLLSRAHPSAPSFQLLFDCMPFAGLADDGTMAYAQREVVLSARVIGSEPRPFSYLR